GLRARAAPWLRLLLGAGRRGPSRRVAGAGAGRVQPGRRGRAARHRGPVRAGRLPAPPHRRLPPPGAGGRIAGHHRRLLRLDRPTSHHWLRSPMRKSIVLLSLFLGVAACHRSSTPSPAPTPTSAPAPTLDAE